jgi:rubredoxin
MSEETKYIHVCPVCDYVHEDHETIPFDEVPSDRLCPACGVEHGWFEKRPV